MAAWHLEIRSADGRTICAADVEARRVDEIEAVRSADTAGILLKGESVAVGYPTITEAKGEYELYRWPLGQKAQPMISKIKR